MNARGAGWLSVGEWNSGHAVKQIDVYVLSDAEDESDPDMRRDFCSLACFVSWVSGILLREGVSAAAQAANILNL